MPNANGNLSDQDVQRIYAALSSEIPKYFGITPATSIFRSAGLLTRGPETHWQPLLGALDQEFRNNAPEDKKRIVRILAQHLMKEDRPDVAESVESLLREHGFRYLDGFFIPLEFYDHRETRFLPTASAVDFSTALTRLVNGDLDGALAAACGTVDTAAAAIYAEHHLGDVTETSFQQRVWQAIEAKGRLNDLEQQLIELGWEANDAKILCQNMKGGLNQLAFVMQSLRARMSDVHGHKPVLDAVVFDSLKLAPVLVSLMT